MRTPAGKSEKTTLVRIITKLEVHIKAPYTVLEGGFDSFFCFGFLPGMDADASTTSEKPVLTSFLVPLGRQTAPVEAENFHIHLERLGIDPS